MKTTNLQAPWRVIVSQHSNQKPSAWEITTRYGGVIAETNNLTNDTIPRLISAAPDLLSALESLAVWNDGKPCFCHVHGDSERARYTPHDSYCDKARAAIDKAKGEA